MEAQLKVSRAVTKAAIQRPFFGSCLLNLRVEMSEKIPTMATDAVHVYWNKEFVDGLSEDETLGVLCHEVMHVILQHCQPWKGKDPRLCNAAMDYVINENLIYDGIILPEGALINRNGDFTGLAWQQVYNILKDIEEKAKQQEDQGGDLGSQEGDGSEAANRAGISSRDQKSIAEQMEGFDEDHVKTNDELSEADMSALKDTVERMAVSAAEQAKAAGKLPGGVDGIIKEIRTSKVDWKGMIRANIKSSSPDDYTFRRPNKKLYAATGIYMPSMESHTIETLVFALDTSGSVSKSEMVRHLSEMNAVSLELKPLKTIVIYTDCNVAKVEEYGPGEEINQLNTRGGGGTEFTPVFDYLEYHGIIPDHLVYFSDMEVYQGAFPEHAPDYPVTWLSTSQDYPVPFGELILVKD